MAGLLLDHNLSPSLARFLRQAGHVVTTAAEMHLEQAGDAEILRIAGVSGLILITADEDFADLHRSSGLDHAGILILPQASLRVIRSIADAVVWLLASDRPLPNELYGWSEVTGWVRRS